MNDDDQVFLILDKANSYANESGISREVTFVPTGLIRFFQPLDI